MGLPLLATSGRWLLLLETLLHAAGRAAAVLLEGRRCAAIGRDIGGEVAVVST